MGELGENTPEPLICGLREGGIERAKSSCGIGIVDLRCSKGSLDLGAGGNAGVELDKPTAA